MRTENRQKNISKLGSANVLCNPHGTEFEDEFKNSETHHLMCSDFKTSHLTFSDCSGRKCRNKLAKISSK